MSLAARSKEIFMSSEVSEKRQILNFVFQNLKLDGKNLLVDLREPFLTMTSLKNSSMSTINCRWPDSNRHQVA